MTCEEIRDSLGAWLDRELEAPAAERVRTHLERCPACFAEKERLEFLDVALKRALESRSAEVTFDGIWSAVERGIRERVWYQRLWDGIDFGFFPLRPAWVMSFAAVLFLGAFFLVRYLPEWRARNSFTFVESIDAHGSNVALFREAETKTTVIWLFEDLENQDEGSEESPTRNAGF
jgi:anti-sigma factor RsiW